MMEMVIINTGLRPMRSPIEPKNAAPIGLTIIPTPKVAKLAKRLEEGSLDGKNKGPKVTAKAPKDKKSYHSKKVPKHAAISILG